MATTTKPKSSSRARVDSSKPIPAVQAGTPQARALKASVPQLPAFGLALVSTEVAEFDDLAGAVAEFVAPAKGIVVTDAESADTALSIRSQIKGYIDQIEARRDGLVRPHNEHVKAVNARATEVKTPLNEIYSLLTNQLRVYQERQDAIRREAARRAELERQEAERKAAEERARQQAAYEQQLEEEAIAAADARRLMGGSPEELEQANEEAHEDLERKAAEKASELARQEALALVDADQKAAQAVEKSNTIKGARKDWDFEVLDLDQVPNHFLKREPNRTAIVSAARGGTTKIPGLRIFEKTIIPNSRHTSVRGLRDRGEG